MLRDQYITPEQGYTILNVNVHISGMKHHRNIIEISPERSCRRLPHGIEKMILSYIRHVLLWQPNGTYLIL